MSAQVTAPTGLALTYTYDPAHRLTGWSNNRGESGSFTLDGMGNRTAEQMKDASGAVAWNAVRSINNINRVSATTEGPNQTSTFGYDANGELITDTNGLNQSTRYGLDGLRRVKSITNAASATAALAYNALDAVTQPATSIFVLDLSGSMQGQRLASMKEALRQLSGADAATTASARYSAFQSRERVVLITFESEVAPPVWVRFEADSIDAARAELGRQADAMTADGGTAIYSALATAEDLARREQQGNPDRFVSIVLLTDGENNSGLSVGDFQRRYAKGLPARIFPILFGEGNVSEMQEIAQLSGGRAFDGRKLRLGQVFKEIRGYQ